MTIQPRELKLAANDDAWGGDSGLMAWLAAKLERITSE